MAELSAPWFKRYPERFGEELSAMERIGFRLDPTRLNSGTVYFMGQSEVDPSRPLHVCYPVGFPSMPPVVYSPVPIGKVLSRHQDPRTFQLCIFGFRGEGWRSSMSGRHAVLEAERLISLYRSGSPTTTNSPAPEPWVSHLSYSKHDSILVPEPFSAWPPPAERTVGKATLLLAEGAGLVRGLLETVEVPGAGKHSAPAVYTSWFNKPSRKKVVVMLSPEPPPLSYGEVVPWLHARGIILPTSKPSWMVIGFRDEGGPSGNPATSWVVVHGTTTGGDYVRCHLTSRSADDVRQPHRNRLFGKTVLMIGCGSLGSHVAVFLAQGGLGAIVLTDHDLYEPGNAVRHQVAARWFGFAKAQALQWRLNDIAPLCEVEVLTDSIGNGEWELTRMQRFQELLEDCDLVIETTGRHAVSRYVNDLCTRLHKPLVVGSVTNGAWSVEVVRYRPGVSGCWGCWGSFYGAQPPPGLPLEEEVFPPGCNQPTFQGASYDAALGGALVAWMATDTLVQPPNSAGGIVGDYLVWSSRHFSGRVAPHTQLLPVPVSLECRQCHD